MALTLEELQAKRSALLAEIGEAEQSVTHGNKSVTMRSVAELERALNILDRQIAESETGSAGRKRVRRRLAYSVGKGL